MIASDGWLPRVPLADALAVAQQIYGQLDPSCERLAIAGSIRRFRPDVGDIELVAIPRYENRPVDVGLFETRWAPVSVLAETLAMLEGKTPGRGEHSAMLERLSGGERYIKLRHLRSGLQVDLFLTTPEQWGLILLIRTGPADYSRGLVTEARRRGFHVAHGRLFHGAGHNRNDGFCDCTQPIPTPTEESVYAALGLPFEPPGRRGVA